MFFKLRKYAEEYGGKSTLSNVEIDLDHHMLSCIADYGRIMLISNEISIEQDDFAIARVPGLNTVPKYKYIPIIDCDSAADIESAINYLTNIRELKFFRIYTRPDHAWIVFDLACDVDVMLWEMAHAPGVDPKYVERVKSDKVACVRAFTKDGTKPTFCDDSLSNILAKQWVSEIKAHFESEDYRRWMKYYTYIQGENKKTPSTSLPNSSESQFAKMVIEKLRRGSY